MVQQRGNHRYQLYFRSKVAIFKWHCIQVSKLKLSFCLLSAEHHPTKIVAVFPIPTLDWAVLAQIVLALITQLGPWEKAMSSSHHRFNSLNGLKKKSCCPLPAVVSFISFRQFNPAICAAAITDLLSASVKKLGTCFQKK